VIAAYRNRLMAAFFVAAGVYGAAMMLFILAFAPLDAADTVKVGFGLGCSAWSIFRLSRRSRPMHAAVLIDHLNLRLAGRLRSVA